MLHTTGKENLSLFILLVLFTIDIDTLQAIGNSKISLAGWSTHLNFILHTVAESSTAFGISPRPLVQQTIRTVSFTFFVLFRSFIRTSQSF